MVLMVKVNKACAQQIVLSVEIFVSASMLPLRAERRSRISWESKAEKSNKAGRRTGMVKSN